MRTHVKRNIAVLLALVIGGTVCVLPGTVTRAEEWNEEEASEAAGQQQETDTESSENVPDEELSQSMGEGEKEPEEESIEPDNADTQTEAGSEIVEGKDSEASDIQDPEKETESEGSSEVEAQESEESTENHSVQDPDGIDSDLDQEESGEEAGDKTVGEESLETGEVAQGTEEAGSKEEILNGEDAAQGGGAEESMDEEESPEDVTMNEEAEAPEAADILEANGKVDEAAVGLQIPEHVTVTIDPWEIDEKGQIYSGQYSIQNTGNALIRLVLKEAIYSLRGGETFIRTEAEGIHDSGEKFIYIRMNFGNGDQLVLTEEGAEYSFILEPGKELQFWFSGEVNENAVQPWGDDEVKIEMDYIWSTEESMSAEAPEMAETPSGAAGTLQENTDMEGDAGNGTGAAVMPGMETGDTEETGQTPDTSYNNEEQQNINTDNEKDNIAVQEAGSGEEE